MNYGYLITLVTLLGTAAQAQTYYVATEGNDNTGDGSSGNPWASITHAVENVPDGAEIIVRPGVYNGRQRIDEAFETGILVRSEVPYQAKLRHNNGAALICYYGRNITVEGFDIAHDPSNTGALVVQIQDLLGDYNGSNFGTDPVVEGIVLRNNIIHDSTDNDLLKVNNGAENITIEGNLFFNQEGSDEHIDINSVVNVVVQDNIFMNNFSGGESDTSSFVVVKDSNGSSDTVVGAEDITIRRNVFINWQGSSAHSFLRFGEDAVTYYQASDCLVENNLFIGNSDQLMRSCWTVMGSEIITFRNNTVAGDLPTRTYAFRLYRSVENQKNNVIRVYNNVFSDPTGTMGTEALVAADFAEAATLENDTIIIDRNLYWNNFQPLPTDPNEALRIGDDDNPIFSDPFLPSQDDLILPAWNGTQFSDGSTSIRDAFVKLVEQYGTTTQPAGPITGLADPNNAPTEDILGNPRDAMPDLGAVEIQQSNGNNLPDFWVIR